MDDPLIFVRAVHFAATLSVTGVALFNVFVAQPTLRPPASPELRVSVVRRLAWIAWIGLRWRCYRVRPGSCSWRSRSAMSR